MAYNAKSILLAIMVASTLLALNTQAKPVPSQLAFTTCANIGRGSGCSGCSATNVDCEWCISPTSDAESRCSPEGFCYLQTTAGGVPYVSSMGLCPDDRDIERIYRGEDLEAADGARDESSRFSPHFDSHYCEFPVTPWRVDRSSNPYGNRDPTGNCLRVNDQLVVGQRKAIDECLIASAALKRYVDPLDDDVMTEKRKECLRLLQSMMCTFNCPKFGVAMDFTNLCASYCERLNQHCDSDIMGCVVANGMPNFPFTVCAARDAPSCFKPDLIPPHSSYEYDLCFFGDAERCSPNKDCKVELSSDPYPSTFTNAAASNAVNYVAGSSGPYCCMHGDTGGYGCHGFLFKITSAAQGTGLSCPKVVANFIADTWGEQQSSYVWGPPRCDGEQVGNYCKASEYIVSGPRPHPNYCTVASRYSNCPGFFYL